MKPSARGFLVAFIVVAIVHLGSITFGLTGIGAATKPFLMLLLIGLVLTSVNLSSHPSVPWLVAGQAFSCIGDIALISEGTMFFIAGMAGFLVAQICYITGYFKLGAKVGYQQRRWVLVVYPLFWVAANAALWSGLGPMRSPIAIYSLALVAMAMTSMTLGNLFGLGGFLFMISDLMIGATVAYGDFPGSHFLVMSTYIVGQLIICLFWLKKVEDAAPADQGSMTESPRRRPLLGDEPAVEFPWPDR